MSRSVNFKPFYWHSEDNEEENEHVIYSAGLNEKSESVVVKIIGFTPYIYLELPKTRKWTAVSVKCLFTHFQKVFRDNAPVSYKTSKKKSLYHLTPMDIMILTFPTMKAMKTFSWKMRNSRFVVPGVGTMVAGSFKAHESNIPSELKFTTTRSLDPSGWITVKETIQEEDIGIDIIDRKFSINDIDLVCHWTDVSKCEEDLSTILLQHSYLSFDIECHSENPNAKLPEPENPKNEIFQISCRFGKLNSDEKQRRVLLTLCTCDTIEDVEVIECKSEKELLIKFVDLTQEENPDMFVGYNIMKFDWQYIIRRFELLKIYDYIAKLSRIPRQRAYKDIVKWHSKAYGTQEFEYVHSYGRMNVDLLPEIERNYKLSSYSLNTVSEYFLKEKKDDVTPKQLFMLYALARDWGKKLALQIFSFTEFRSDIELRMPKVMCGANKHVNDLKTSLLEATTVDEVREYLKLPMWITGQYCDQDTNLPIRLMKRLNMLTAMEAMSNCTNVPMSYLHTRGQQIKVIGQFLRNTIKENIVIPICVQSAIERYQGATVIEANAGDYDNIVTFDFESLYPSMMISYNICYTTLVIDENIPDDECHILEWSEHKYCKCEKDEFPGKKCSDKKKIFCADHRYRFYKVVINADGTRSREGLLPRMERNMLSERKIKKKEMVMWQARVSMNRGHATEKDIIFFKKKGYEIIEKGSLTKAQDSECEMKGGVCNAQQLALKVSANSMYGILGARKGYIPLLEGAASVTAMGRFSIIDTIRYIREKYPITKLVYGDTDSCMLTFDGLTIEEIFDFAEKVGDETTHYLKTQLLEVPEETYVTTIDGDKKRIDKVKESEICFIESDEEKILVWRYIAIFINLEFENVYGRYLLLSKKRYLAYSVNRSGEVIGVTKKGVVLARRDNSKYLRETYNSLITHILDRGNEKLFMYLIYDFVHKLFTRQIPENWFVIYMGVKNVVEYAEKKKIKMANGDELEQFVSKIDGSLFDQPTGWDDDRFKI